MPKSWTVADAKSRFSEVIDTALESGPQTVTRHGKPAVVIVSAEEWHAKAAPKGSIAEFFLASPLRGSGLKVPRLKGALRRAKV